MSQLSFSRSLPIRRSGGPGSPHWRAFPGEDGGAARHFCLSRERRTGISGSSPRSVVRGGRRC